jgi:GTPase involved in cell partitioning and DNA repair
VLLLQPKKEKHKTETVKSKCHSDCNSVCHCLQFIDSSFSVQVPIGTIVKTSTGRVVGDLKDEGTMFVAARGGAGGHGNHFFISDTLQAPKIAEYGAEGEELQYVLEVRSMAHIGLVRNDS